MTVYHYEAAKRSGEKIHDKIDLGSEVEVRLFLRRRGLRALKIKRESLFSKNIQIGSGVDTKTLAVATRLLAVMIKSGVPLLQSLTILARGEKNLVFKKILTDINDSVASGSAFWESIAKHKAFSKLYVHLIRSGEVGGDLAGVLQRLAIYMEKDLSLRNKIKGAMFYPAMILSVSGLVLFGFVAFIIPKFKDMILGSGGEVPAITQAILDISDFVTGNLGLIFFSIIAVVAFSIIVKDTPGVRRIIDTFFLKGPIFASLSIKSASARFLRTMSTMLDSGVDIIDSIKICKMTFNNVLLEEILDKAANEVAEGGGIAPSLAKSGVFPDMMIQMINVGEETGRVGEVMDKVADFYEEEVDVAITAFVKLIEPLMLVFLGGTIGVMFIGMYLPIFRMAGDAGGI